MRDRELYLEAMEFILDGVALSTEQESKAELGMYLVGLVVADQQEQLKPEKLDCLRQLIQLADEVESQKMAL
ncbi:hypothetical protein MHO82_12895 [Vibrio sp. Of7-15]|uniref:hypothetical protein n=1 Tax=Vibrio sp. Of7-15 TaxID=2724879 RepID=UPI001EF25CDE|nr:hypothetical protein [Vibrio sp. Of7-15]MCG7497761.1 hypothetical protein [Vibrio sp. Of7-15]